MSDNVRFLESVIHLDDKIEMMFMQPKRESGEVFMEYYVIVEYSAIWAENFVRLYDGSCIVIQNVR